MKNSNVKMLLFSTIAVLALSCNSGSKETEKNNEKDREEQEDFWLTLEPLPAPDKSPLPAPHEE